MIFKRNYWLLSSRWFKGTAQGNERFCNTQKWFGQQDSGAEPYRKELSEPVIDIVSSPAKHDCFALECHM